MAIQQKYDQQFPFVGTLTQRQHVERESQRRKISLAEVIRDALDARYGLVDGEVPDESSTAGRSQG
jgi:hypothetical protein